MAQIVHIVGTDTGVGKTFVTAYLLWSLTEAGFKVRAIKPLASGSLDDAKILRRFHRQPVKNMAEISPFFFRKPLAPLMAASPSNPAPSLNEVAHFVAHSQVEVDFLLVEGIGGVAVPIKKGFLYSALIPRMPGKILIVGPNRLGVLNQILLTHEHVLKSGNPLIGLVLRNPAKMRSLEISNERALKRLFPKTPIFKIPHFLEPVAMNKNFELLQKAHGQALQQWVSDE